MTLPLFDSTYYLAQNPDIVLSGYTRENAHLHYLEYGARELRAPTPWFDGQAYLEAWPDLSAAGVTIAGAFSHYVHQGMREGRAPAPAFDPGSFDYAAYANANADLLAAFGISDAAHLTAGQQQDLWAHYLGYGLQENRPGVAFAEAKGNPPDQAAQPHHGGEAAPDVPGAPVKPVSPEDRVPPDDHGRNIAVDGTAKDHVYIGGAGNDTFSAGQGLLDGATLQGKGGDDSLFATLGGATVSAILQSVEKASFDVAGAKNILKLAGAGLQSIEVNHDATAESGLTVQGGAVFGDSLNVALSGGKAGVASAFTLALTGDHPHRITVDGSSAPGDQTFSITGAQPGDVVFQTGGAGNDFLVGTAGVDTMTGGDGADIFRFNDRTALVQTDGTNILGIDVVADGKADDTVKYSYSKARAINRVMSGTLDGVGEIEDNVLVFNKGYTEGKNLTTLLNGIEKAADADPATQKLYCLFHYDHGYYLMDMGPTAALNDTVLVRISGTATALHGDLALFT